MLRIRTRSGVIAGVLSVLAPAAAQPYPNRPVRVVVPFAPGGSTDIVARILAQRLSESLGQPVVVENRGGGGTIIGTDTVAKATPDGYTLLQCTVTMAINVGLKMKLPYDTLRDFAPITLISRQAHVLVVTPGLPVKSVMELLQLARAKPGSLNFGSPGNHSGGQLAGELFKSLAGVKLVHVPYKGTAPALTDLLGGQIQMMFGTILAVVPHVRNGKLRGLAVSTAKRSGALPDLPTIAEAGVPGYEASSWMGMLAPARTPEPVLRRLNAELMRILSTQELRERLAADGGEPAGTTPAEFVTHLNSEIAKWEKVIAEAGIKAD